MNAMAPCPKDSPLMIAWEAHKATDEFKNSYSWATRFIAPDDPIEIERIEASGANPLTRHLKEQYVQGSLWAQFMAGFLAANPDGASPEVKAEGGRGEPVADKPFGHFFWCSNGDGTESPDFCQGDIPPWKRSVRDVKPLYTHSASPPDVEAIRANEREKCALVAERYADLYDVVSFSSDVDEQVAATRSKEQAATAIASAIRTGGQK